MARKNWGKRSMKDYLGNGYTQEDKFVTYEEMTQKYNEQADKPVTRNTICHWYHKAMLKLATNICESNNLDLSADEIKRISRSMEFQTYIRDVLESRDKGELSE